MWFWIGVGAFGLVVFLAAGLLLVMKWVGEAHNETFYGE